MRIGDFLTRPLSSITRTIIFDYEKMRELIFSD